jgi:uncharacterized protein YecT (DUF1311 family)
MGAQRLRSSGRGHGAPFPSVGQDVRVIRAARIQASSRPSRIVICLAVAVTFCALLASCSKTSDATVTSKSSLPPGCTQTLLNGPYGCSSFFRAAADRRINREMRFLFKRMPGQSRALVSSEKLWLIWRNADCHVVEFNGEGDLGWNTVQDCETDLDTQYSASLKSLYVEMFMGDAQLSRWS